MSKEVEGDRRRVAVKSFFRHFGEKLRSPKGRKLLQTHHIWLDGELSKIQEGRLSKLTGAEDCSQSSNFVREERRRESTMILMYYFEVTIWTTGTACCDLVTLEVITMKMDIFKDNC